MNCGIKARSEHSQFLLNSLSTMKDERTMCDFTIKVGDTSFQAHRVVLAACSDYFKGMLSNKMLESQKGQTDLKSVHPDIFRIFMQFMYTGEADVTSANCCAVLEVADMLQCRDLKSHCILFLRENLDAECCLAAKLTAHNLGLEQLEKEAEQFAAEHIEDLASSEDFLLLEYDDFIELIKKSQKSVESVWKPMICWIEYDRQRKSKVHDVISFFDLNKSSFIFLYQTIWFEPLVQASLSLRRKVAMAATSKLRKAHVNESNCFGILGLVRSNGGENQRTLSEKVWPFFIKNLRVLGQYSEFISLEKIDIEKIYEGIDSWSTETWTPLERWVKANKKKRMSKFLQIMKNVNSRSLTFNFVYGTMLADSTLRKSKQFEEIGTAFLLRVMASSDLDTANCFDIFKLLTSNQIQGYREGIQKVLRFISDHLSNLMVEDEFLKIDKDYLLGVLKIKIREIFDEDGMHTYLPDIAWYAISAWTKHFDQQSRLPELKSILEKLGPSRFSFSLLLNTIITDPMVKTSPGCEELVTFAVFSKVHFSNLNPEACFKILTFARQYPSARSESVIKCVREYMKTCFEEITSLEGFTGLKGNDLTSLLQSEKCTEESKWKAALKWLEANLEERTEYLPTILEQIKLEKLTRAFIRSEIYGVDLVRNSKKCTDIIIEALLQPDVSKSPSATIVSLNANAPSFRPDSNDS